MNENQPHASNITNNTISNTVNKTGFNFEKYDPYVDVLRILFVPRVDERISELLQLFHTDKTTLDTPSYWERCLNIVSTIKYEVGVVQSYLKQASCYLVNSRLVNSLINTLLLSNRLDKVCRDLDSLGEKNLLRCANAWNFVNEKSYWRVTRQSVSITPEGENSGSLLEAEVGSVSSAYPNSNLNPGSSPRRYRNVRKFSKRGSRSRKSNLENSSFPSQCAEFGSNNNDDGGKKLKVLIGDAQSSKYSEIRKSSVPCKCENLIKHFIKTDFIESPVGVKAKSKLEKALKGTCFSLNQILEPMDPNNVQKCKLLCKLKENYVKIQLKKQEINGSKTCLFTERIDVSKKDLAALRNRSLELEDISEEISRNSKATSNGRDQFLANGGPHGSKDDNCQLIENGYKNLDHLESGVVKDNNDLSMKNDLTIKKSSVMTKDNFDLNESDLRDSKVNIVSSTKIYNTGVPKKRNKCLDRKNCGKSRGELCRCSGLCFCELDLFDDDYTTARTSIKSWESSVKCDSEHSCNCSSGSSIGSVVEKKKNCCSGGNCDGDENGCGSKGSNIDIYININENDNVSGQSQDFKAMKSISVQTIEENLELRPAEFDGKSEDSGSIFPVSSSVFEALKTIAEEVCGCDEKIEACHEKQLIDSGDSFEENDWGENSCDSEENSLKDLPKNESRGCISEGFVKNMVDKIEGNNLDLKETMPIEKNEALCSVSLQDVKTERTELSFGNEKHEIDCDCSDCSGSLKEIKNERKESCFKNENDEEQEDDCNCDSCPGSLEEMKLERPKSCSEDKKYDDDCNCSTCSISSQEMKPERQEPSKKHEDDCNCEPCSISSQEERPKLSFEDENHERIEENLQENELRRKSACSIGSFQDEIHELAKRKSEISERGKEVVDEIKAPVKLQIDEKDEGCGCTVDSEDMFTSAHSVLQKSAVEIELSKDRASLSPIVEMEFREVELLELKPRALSSDSGKVKQELKTVAEEKSSVEESEKRKASLEKKLEVSKIVTAESSAPEPRRSVTSDVSKISRVSLALAEADCRRSSNHKNNICLHKVYMCDCSEADRFSKFPVSKKNQNYQSINANRLQRRKYTLPMDIREIILSVFRNVRLVFTKKGCQKLGHAIRLLIHKILKKRNKATSTVDLPMYTHHLPKKNRKAASKFSSRSKELFEGENRCPAHQKTQNFYRKNNEATVPREFLSSTKQHKEAINQNKQLHRHRSPPKNPRQLRKSNSCFVGSNCDCHCNCNCYCHCNYNYKLSKNWSDTSFSTFSQVSRVDNFGKNGSGDSNSRCDSNYRKKKRKIAARHLIEFLETVPLDE